MLAIKRSAGATPVVNLRKPLHVGKESHKQGIHPGFETKGKHHQKSKSGISGSHKKSLVSSQKKVNYWSPTIYSKYFHNGIFTDYICRY